ncbi:hypothetical protein T484DRAFT_1767199, partial [Baffinella frigidus]
MEAGTRELLGKAEGKVWGHVDKEDDVFEFGSRAITEDALLEMRRRNANAAQRAMADLKGGGRLGSLPAVSAAAARRPPGFSKASRAPPPRRGGLKPRAQTPTEVRSAAEQEMLADEQEQERLANTRPRSSRSRPGTADGKGSVGSGAKRAEEGSESHQEGMAREATLMFKILDWQKTARSRGFDIAKMLSLDPQGLFDKELKQAASLLNRHNSMLRKYTSAFKGTLLMDMPAESTLETGGGSDASEQGARGTGRTHSEGGTEGGTEVSSFHGSEGAPPTETSSVMASSIAPSHPSSHATTFDAISRSFLGGVKGRSLQEDAVRQMSEEAARLRQRALAIIEKGGVEHATAVEEDSGDEEEEDDPFETLGPMDRNTLFVLRGLLEVGLDAMEDVDTGTSGKALHLRRMLQDMRTEHDAGKTVKRRPPARRRTNVAASSFNSQMARDSSLSVGESLAEEMVEADEMYDMTMQLLGATEMWSAHGKGEVGQELEERLYEMQERNRRLMWQAVQPFAREFEVTTEEEPLWTSAQANRKTRGKRKPQVKRVLGVPYYQSRLTKVYTYTPSGGFADMDDDAERSLGSGAEDFLPADRKRLREAAAGRRGRKQPLRKGGGTAWLDAVLPASEAWGESDAEGGGGDGKSGIDMAFLNTPLAKQVMASMAKMPRGEADDMAETLRAMRESVAKAHAGVAKGGKGDKVGDTQEKIVAQVQRLRAEVISEIKAIFGLVAESRLKLEEAQKMDADMEAKKTQEEAQKLRMAAEERTLAVRRRFNVKGGFNVDFLPPYLRDFITSKEASANTLFDRGRILAMQMKAQQEEHADMIVQERRERRVRRENIAAGIDQDASDDDVKKVERGETLTLRDLSTDERRILKECNTDLAAVNSLLSLVHSKQLASRETPALKLSKQLKMKMRQSKARRLKTMLPLPLKALMETSRPLLDLWREGLIEPAICDAVESLRQINTTVARAHELMTILEEGDDLTPAEEREARELLESAIGDAVSEGDDLTPAEEREARELLESAIGDAVS